MQATGLRGPLKLAVRNPGSDRANASMVLSIVVLFFPHVDDVDIPKRIHRALRDDRRVVAFAFRGRQIKANVKIARVLGSGQRVGRS